MRSLFENKRLVLLLAVLALGALTVLAISLNQVPFREGQHFGQKETAEFQSSAEEMGQIWLEVPIWKQVFLWTMLGLGCTHQSFIVSRDAQAPVHHVCPLCIYVLGRVLFTKELWRSILCLQSWSSGSRARGAKSGGADPRV
jgi:hypothetical protein